MATVIRAGDVARFASRLAPMDLADHMTEARAVVADARIRAARMLESAKSEAGRLGPQAQKKGFDQGYQQGYEKAYREGKEKGQRDGHEEAHAAAMTRFDEQHAAIVSDVTRVLDELSTRREAIELAARQELLDFAIAIATKLTYRIGTLDREAAVENLRRALQLVQSKTDLTIRAHPDDLAAIEEFADSFLRRVHSAGGVRIVSDENIAPGGCVVNDETSEVDATLDTQMDEIVALLVGGMSEEATDEKSEEARDG